VILGSGAQPTEAAKAWIWNSNGAWATGWTCGSPWSAMPRRAAWRGEEQPAAPSRLAPPVRREADPGGL